MRGRTALRRKLFRVLRALLFREQQKSRACDKDGRVDASCDADEEREHEVVQIDRPREVKRQKHEDERERGINRAGERLIYAVIDDGLEFFLSARKQEV